MLKTDHEANSNEDDVMVTEGSEANKPRARSENRKEQYRVRNDPGSAKSRQTESKVRDFSGKAGSAQAGAEWERS